MPNKKCLSEGCQKHSIICFLLFLTSLKHFTVPRTYLILTRITKVLYYKPPPPPKKKKKKTKKKKKKKKKTKTKKKKKKKTVLQMTNEIQCFYKIMRLLLFASAVVII